MKYFTAFHNGCEPTAVDTSSTVSRLISLGLHYTESDDEDVDLVVFLGCTFTKDKEEEIQELVEKELAQRPSACVIVSGCFLRKLPMGDRVFYARTHEVVDFVRREFLHESGGNTEDSQGEEPDNLAGSLMVSEGCFSNCSYCSIKRVRGDNRSVPPDELLKRARAFYDEGGRRIKLLGQEVCAYGMDIGTNLPDLVWGFWKHCPELEVEYGSMNPKWLKRYSTEALGIFSDNRVRGNIHMPLQSASDRLLKLMRRGYTLQEASELYDRFRSHGIERISTDVIAGFPTETEEEHEETVKFLENRGFSYAQIFAYDERPFTDASEMPQLPREIRLQRACELIAAYIEAYADTHGISPDEIVTGEAHIPFNCNFSLNRISN